MGLSQMACHIESNNTTDDKLIIVQKTTYYSNDSLRVKSMK